MQLWGEAAAETDERTSPRAVAPPAPTQEGLPVERPRQRCAWRAGLLVSNAQASRTGLTNVRGRHFPWEPSDFIVGSFTDYFIFDEALRRWL